MNPEDSARLTFRPLTIADAGLLDSLNRAPGVMKFLDHHPPTPGYVQTQFVPEKLSLATSFPGYGLWLAHLKTTGSFAGWFSLSPHTLDAGNAELGYRLLPQYWGQGLASEGARALLSHAFDQLNAHRVYAVTMAVNLPSRRVMERIGLKYVRTFHEEFNDPLPGTEEGEVEYALTRADWLLRGP